MTTVTDLEVYEQRGALARQDELSLEQVVAQVQKIQAVQQAVMQEDEHYGVIPGTGSKPSLLKPGAEKLCLTFRLAPSYTIERVTSPEGHLDVFVTAQLTHIVSGANFGEGVGACTSRESKYAYRTANKKCPKCGSEAIIKGKAEYGGGWVCFNKKGGCGAKYQDGDQVIEGQRTGRVANEDLPDTWNTVVKMAKKRALVDAVLTATAASDIFTQDIEEAVADVPAEPVADPGPDAPPMFQAPTAPRGLAHSGDAAGTTATAPQIKNVQRLIDKVTKDGTVDAVALHDRFIERYGSSVPAEWSKAQASEIIQGLMTMAGEEPK